MLVFCALARHSLVLLSAVAGFLAWPWWLAIALGFAWFVAGFFAATWLQYNAVRYLQSLGMDGDHFRDSFQRIAFPNLLRDLIIGGPALCGTAYLVGYLVQRWI